MKPINRKMHLLLLSFLLIPGPDTYSKDEIIAISTIISQSPLIEGTFYQERRTSNIETSIKSQGEFLFVKELGIYWHVKSPVDFSINFLNPDNKFTSSKEKKTNKMEKKIGELLVTFLSGDLEKLQKQFTINHQINKDNDTWEIMMTPRRRAVKRHLSEISIRGNYHIESIVLISNELEKTSIVFSDIVDRSEPQGNQCKIILKNLGAASFCTPST